MVRTPPRSRRYRVIPNGYLWWRKIELRRDYRKPQAARICPSRLLSLLRPMCSHRALWLAAATDSGTLDSPNERILMVVILVEAVASCSGVAGAVSRHIKLWISSAPWPDSSLGLHKSYVSVCHIH